MTVVAVAVAETEVVAVVETVSSDRHLHITWPVPMLRWMKLAAIDFVRVGIPPSFIINRKKLDYV